MVSVLVEISTRRTTTKSTYQDPCCAVKRSLRFHVNQRLNGTFPSRRKTIPKHHGLFFSIKLALALKGIIQGLLFLFNECVLQVEEALLCFPSCSVFGDKRLLSGAAAAATYFSSDFDGRGGPCGTHTHTYVRSGFRHSRERLS